LRQKAKRQQEPKQTNKSQKLLGGKTPSITTDIVILQKATSGFEYIAAPINATGEDLLSLASVVKAKVIQEYGNQNLPLNLVAITLWSQNYSSSTSSYFWRSSYDNFRLVSPVQETSRADVNDCC
jgi:hypothetical protein